MLKKKDTLFVAAFACILFFVFLIVRRIESPMLEAALWSLGLGFLAILSFVVYRRHEKFLLRLEAGDRQRREELKRIHSYFTNQLKNAFSLYSQNERIKKQVMPAESRIIRMMPLKHLLKRHGSLNISR